MDEDERQYGDHDTQVETARLRALKRRAIWYPTADDPYPEVYEDEQETS
jgi:hypothetical protein